MAGIAHTWKRWTGAISNGIKSAIHTLRDPIQAWLLDDTSNAGKHVGDAFKNAVYVYAAISGVAEACASVMLQIQDENNDAVDRQDDPSVKILANPNALQSRKTFIEGTLINLQRDGAVFWYSLDPLRAVNPLKRAIHIARKQNMKPMIAGGRLVGWKFTPRGAVSPIELPIEQVCRLYFYDPDDELGGLSPSHAAQLSIDQFVFASRYNASVFRNGADPGSIFEMEGTPTEEQREQIADAIRKWHTGTENAKRPFFGWGGLKWKPGVQSMKDMDWLEGKRDTRNEQLAAYKVPQVIAGILDDASLNNTREQVLLFWDHRGKALLSYVVECWNGFVQRAIDPRKHVEPIWTSVEALMERAIEKFKGALSLQEFGIPLNVIIEAMDMPFPTFPWGDEPLVAAGKIPITVLMSDASGMQQNDRLPEGQMPGDEGDEPEDGDGTIEAAFRAVERAIDHDEKTARERAIHRNWWASFAGLRELATLQYRSFFLRQRDDMIARLESIGLPNVERGGKEHCSQSSGTRALDHRGRIKAEVERWLDRVVFDLEIEDGRLRVLSQEQFKETAILGGTQAGAEAAVASEFVFNIESPAMRRHLRNQRLRIRNVNRTTQRAVRRVLVDGLDAGESLGEMSERIRRVMGTRSGSQAFTITQTEIHEAISAGRKEGFKQAGIKGCRWLTSGQAVEPDGPVRIAHFNEQARTRDQAVSVYEKFRLVDVKSGVVSECDFPAQGVLPPGQRINCRCMILAAIGKDGGAVDYAKVHFRDDRGACRRLNQWFSQLKWGGAAKQTTKLPGNQN